MKLQTPLVRLLFEFNITSSSSSSSFILKTSIFPRSARVRRFSRNEAPPHIPEHCPFRVQTKRLHIILHTFIPSLPPSTRTSHSCHHPISTGQHPIIPTLTFHMPKPPQSTLPHHLINALYTQKTTNPHCVSYPSATLRTIFSRLRRFAFFIAQVSVPYVNALWTQALYILPFMRYDAPLAVRIGDTSLNFAQAHLTLALAASSTPPPAPSVSPK